jgi:hypothetical protein
MGIYIIPIGGGGKLGTQRFRNPSQFIQLFCLPNLHPSKLCYTAFYQLQGEGTWLGGESQLSNICRLRKGVRHLEWKGRLSREQCFKMYILFYLSVARPRDQEMIVIEKIAWDMPCRKTRIY